MKKTGKKNLQMWVIAVLFWIMPFSKAISQEIKLSASVDQTTVGLSERFQYEIEVSGSVQNLPEISIPDLSSFALISGPNVSSSFNIVNFNMTASKRYTFLLMPKSVGKFKIEPARVEHDGNVITSNAVEITVTKESSSAGAGTPQTQPGNGKSQPNLDLSKSVFIRATPSKKSAYVNEEITIVYKLYFNSRIASNELLSLPEAASCWVEEYPTSQNPTISREILNGIRYNVAEIRKIAVFPKRSGNITISPLEMKIDVVVQQRRRARDLFEEFFSDPFGQAVSTRISSGEVNLNIKELPQQGKPQNFSGLVGDFNLESAVGKQETKTNEAISYRVKISGRGLLKFINELPINFSPNFEVYDPKFSESINKQGSAVRSSKEFEYVIIPRVPGEQKIESASIAYFNPEDKKYHVLNIPEYTINVERGEDLGLGIASGTNISKEEVRLLGQDIRFIKEQVPDFKPIGQMPYSRWWFYLAIILPTILFGIALGYHNHLNKMSSNIQYARSRRAAQQAKSRLKKASLLQKEGKTAEFYGEVARALLGFVADKTNRSGAGLVREEVAQIFSNYNVEQNLSNEFFSCLDQADFYRFAPAGQAEKEIPEFYSRAEKVLVELTKYFK